MKIEIKYFTSTGNTFWMCERAKEYFEEHGHEVILSNCECEGMEFRDESDLVGIFYPVWGSTIPSIIGEELLKNRPARRKMFFIGNCGAFSGDTGVYWKKKIERKLGYDLFYADHIVMPLNLNIPWGDFMKIPDAEEQKAILEEAKVRLKTIVDEILAGKRKLKGKDLFGRMGGILQRFQEKSCTHLWIKAMKIDAEKCTNCCICAKVCPTNNIKVSDKKLELGDNCIFCLRCYNLCPKEAFLVGKQTKDRKRYIRYRGQYSDIVKRIVEGKW